MSDDEFKSIPKSFWLSGSSPAIFASPYRSGSRRYKQSFFVAYHARVPREPACLAFNLFNNFNPES